MQKLSSDYKQLECKREKEFKDFLVWEKEMQLQFREKERTYQDKIEALKDEIDRLKDERET